MDEKEREVRLDKQDLEAWQIGQNDLVMFEQDLAGKRREIEEKFYEDNKELIEKIDKLSIEQSKEREIFEELAELEFKKTGNKQLIGGLGIRVGTKFIYEEKDAFQWAVNHALCLNLNKRDFEKIAKTQDIEFVKKQEKVTVTFPKEIKFDEND